MKYYKHLYKYILAEQFVYKTTVTGYTVNFSWVSLRPDGTIIIAKDYAWDGASGPTIDTKDSMVAALIHDGFYQLMRRKDIPIVAKAAVDKDFYKNLVHNGMFVVRAYVWYLGVKIFAKFAAARSDTKQLIEI